MTKQKPIEIFTPPNVLKAKVGGSLAPIDKAAIARANQALDNLSGQFQEWIEDELVRLDAAWSDYSDAPAAERDSKVEKIHCVAHDLKGLAKTYEYPLVGRMAACLCRISSDEVDRTASPANLIKAHIDGIRAAIKGGIKTEEHPVGLSLVQELETQAADFEDRYSLKSD